jgi:hypothetical protein
VLICHQIGEMGGGQMGFVCWAGWGDIILSSLASPVFPRFVGDELFARVDAVLTAKTMPNFRLRS